MKIKKFYFDLKIFVKKQTTKKFMALERLRQRKKLNVSFRSFFFKKNVFFLKFAHTRAINCHFKRLISEIKETERKIEKEI